MTPYEIRNQVLYNIFGEGTPPASAVSNCTTYLKEVLREIEDMGKWWWSRRVIGGSIATSTIITGETVRVAAGELPELTSLIKDQRLMAVENIVVYDAAVSVVNGTTVFGKINEGGHSLVQVPYDSAIISLIAMRTFNPAMTGDQAPGVEVKYSDPGKPAFYFFGNDIMNLQGDFFSSRIFAYPIPDKATLYTAEISIRLDFDFDFNPNAVGITGDGGVAAAQNVNDRIAPALIAGGTTKLAAAFSHVDISQRFAADYRDQITRMRMDNARMVCNNLMECEYHDL